MAQTLLDDILLAREENRSEKDYSPAEVFPINHIAVRGGPGDAPDGNQLDALTAAQRLMGDPFRFLGCLDGMQQLVENRPNEIFDIIVSVYYKK